MSSPENPFDQTVQDPFDPTQAIEDPMHGPEAVARLLTIPPMRKLDGTYHVFGGFYAAGTNTFDANGKPFIQFGGHMSDPAFFRDVQALNDWIMAYHKGDLPAREEMELPTFDLEARPYFVLPMPASTSIDILDIGAAFRDATTNLGKHIIPLTSIEGLAIEPYGLPSDEPDQPQE